MVCWPRSPLRGAPGSPQSQSHTLPLLDLKLSTTVAVLLLAAAVLLVFGRRDSPLAAVICLQAAAGVVVLWTAASLPLRVALAKRLEPPCGFARLPMQRVQGWALALHLAVYALGGGLLVLLSVFLAVDGWSSLSLSYKAGLVVVWLAVPLLVASALIAKAGYARWAKLKHTMAPLLPDDGVVVPPSYGTEATAPASSWSAAPSVWDLPKPILAPSGHVLFATGAVARVVVPVEATSLPRVAIQTVLDGPTVPRQFKHHKLKGGAAMVSVTVNQACRLSARLVATGYTDSAITATRFTQLPPPDLANTLGTSLFIRLPSVALLTGHVGADAFVTARLIELELDGPMADTVSIPINTGCVDLRHPQAPHFVWAILEARLHGNPALAPLLPNSNYRCRVMFDLQPGSPFNLPLEDQQHIFTGWSRWVTTREWESGDAFATNNFHYLTRGASAIFRSKEQHATFALHTDRIARGSKSYSLPRVVEAIAAALPSSTGVVHMPERSDDNKGAVVTLKPGQPSQRLANVDTSLCQEWETLVLSTAVLYHWVEDPVMRQTAVRLLRNRPFAVPRDYPALVWLVAPVDTPSRLAPVERAAAPTVDVAVVVEDQPAPDFTPSAPLPQEPPEAKPISPSAAAGAGGQPPPIAAVRSHTRTVLAPCGHSACLDCARQWMKADGSCHECRAEIESIVKAFIEE